MIDLQAEKPLTLTAAAKLPQLRRNGRSSHIATVYRWAERGCRGIVLESIVIGGSRCTTAEAVDRWIVALTASAGGEPTPIQAPRQRELAHSAPMRI